MNTLFLMLFLVSMIAVPVILVLLMIKRIKKQPVKKMLIGLGTSAVVWVGSLVGLAGTGPEVIQPEALKLEIVGEKEEYDINSAICVDIQVTPENADLSALEYLADSDKVIFEKNYILTGSEEGTYQVYASAGGVKSNVLTVTVTDMTAREEAEKKEIAQQVREEVLKEAVQIAETDAAAKEKIEQEAEALRSSLEKEEEARKTAENKIKELEVKLEEEKKARENAEKTAEEAQEKIKEEMSARKAAEQEVEKAEQELQKVDEKLAAVQKTSEMKTAGVSGTVAAAAVSGTKSASEASASAQTKAAEVQQTTPAETQQGQEVTYVLNTNTKKFHYPSCSSADDIKPENYATSNGSRDEVIAQGYVPCKRCNP